MLTLETCKPFRILDANELAALRQIGREKQYSSGQQIFKEGDPGDGVYVLMQGKVEISARMAQDVERVFAEVGPGEIFGEMAVIEFKPRSAGARAAQDSTVFFIPRQELMAMI